MLSIHVRIVCVDHNGFCGRDFHPGDEHVGRIANVLSITVLDSDGMPVVDPTDQMMATEDCLRLFTCTMIDEPELLQLMEHEIEFVSGRTYSA
jgi:hypothetical protein